MTKQQILYINHVEDWHEMDWTLESGSNIEDWLIRNSNFRTLVTDYMPPASLDGWKFDHLVRCDKKQIKQVMSKIFWHEIQSSQEIEPNFPKKLWWRLTVCNEIWIWTCIYWMIRLWKAIYLLLNSRESSILENDNNEFAVPYVWIRIDIHKGQ